MCGDGNVSEKQNNIAKVKVEKISHASYEKLVFKLIYSNEQITVEVKSTSDEIVKLNTLMITVYGVSGIKNSC